LTLGRSRMERKLKRRVYPILALQLVFAEPPVSLPVPVDGVRPSAIRNTWRAPRDGGRHHQGIDIFANPEPRFGRRPKVLSSEWDKTG
jgi:peptidoglycan LD-endopeptidase LytH